MRERDQFPAGVPCWIDIEVPDPQAAMRFYGGLFGWSFDDNRPPGSPGRYSVARLRDGDVAGVGLLASGAASRAAWNTYVCVDVVDATVGKVRQAGGSVLIGPSDLPGAARVAVCSDPVGASFRLWEPRATPGCSAPTKTAPGT